MSVEIPDGVRTSLKILRTHRRMMDDSGSEEPMEERIAKVVDAFEQVGTRWTLVGAHAVGTLTEPRATEDFDFVVEERKMKAILNRLASAFGELQTTDMGAAIRVLSLNIDLIRSSAHPLFQRALEETRSAQTWRIPAPEVLIALKFLSSVNPWRGLDKRRQDVLDLIRVYKALADGGIDRRHVLELGGEAFPGGDVELGRLLDRVDRGEPITI